MQLAGAGSAACYAGDKFTGTAHLGINRGQRSHERTVEKSGAWLDIQQQPCSIEGIPSGADKTHPGPHAQSREYVRISESPGI